MDLTRRGFLAAAGLAAVAPMAADGVAGLEGDPTPPEVPPFTGEPYVLAGRRLVFTNWHFIRPGSFGWYDAAGNNVTVGGSEGPMGAQLRTHDMPVGIRLMAKPAQRRGPLIEPGKPWETVGISLSTIIRDGAVFRAWGTCQGEKGRFQCVFESDDGLDWRRPEAGVVEVDGSTANNLIGPPWWGGTVFIDPSAPENERYKAVTEGRISANDFEAYRERRPGAWERRAQRADVGQIFAVLGSISPDGLHWTNQPEPLVVEHSDTQIVAHYDTRLRQYVIYTRNWSVGERDPSAPDDRGLSWLSVGRRSIGRTAAAQFADFPLSQILLEPGPEMAPSDVLYTNCRTEIPGAPDHHLMFPTVWHTGSDSTSVVLASSRNGLHWHYLPGGPVLTTAAFGEFDGGCVFAHPNLLELPNGDFALPYTGYLFPHKYPRGQWRFSPGYAVWPKGRLVALEALEHGEFATVALRVKGTKLRLNVSTKRGGRVLVEAARGNGEPLPGRDFAHAVPIIGDHQAAPVVWDGQEELGAGAEEAIILRFRLHMAALYAIDFV